MHSSIQKHSLFSGFPWNFSLAQVLSRCAVQSSTRSMVSGPRCVWRGLHHWSFFLWTFWAVSVLGGKLKKPSAMKTNSVMNGEAMPCFTSSGGRRASHHVFVLEPSRLDFHIPAFYIHEHEIFTCSLAHGIYCAKSGQDTNRRLQSQSETMVHLLIFFMALWPRLRWRRHRIYRRTGT